MPLAALTKLCSEVKPDLTVLSFPVVRSDAEVNELVQALVHEVSPVSAVALGGHGAVAMRDSLMDSNIMLLEDFRDLDIRLDRMMRKHVFHR